MSKPRHFVKLPFVTALLYFGMAAFCFSAGLLEAGAGGVLPCIMLMACCIAFGAWSLLGGRLPLTAMAILLLLASLYALFSFAEYDQTPQSKRIKTIQASAWLLATTCYLYHLKRFERTRHPTLSAADPAGTSDNPDRTRNPEG